MNCESLSNNPSLLQEKSIFCRNLIQTGCFPNGNYDFLSDFKIICEFSSNLIRVKIPVVIFFIPRARNSKYPIFFPKNSFSFGKNTFQ